jgi:hypothetical protein
MTDRCSPLSDAVEWSWRENDFLHKDRESLSMVQETFSGGAETGPNNTGEGHPLDEMLEDRMRANKMYTEVGRTFRGENVMRGSSSSCIHNTVNVY